MSVADGHSTKKQQEMLFIHVQQQTRTERENDREKKRLDTHTELFIQWIKCRHRWLDVDIDSLFTIFFPFFFS